MNLIPMIAKELGVEVGEEFEANGKTCKFEKDGLIHYNDDGHGKEWWCRAECTMFGLLTGKFEVKKLPFAPKEGDKYFYVGWFIGGEEVCVFETKLFDCDTCYHHKYCGNCFRTEAEAEKHKYEIYEKLTGKKWEE